MVFSDVLKLVHKKDIKLRNEETGEWAPLPILRQHLPSTTAATIDLKSDCRIRVLTDLWRKGTGQVRLILNNGILLADILLFA